jgi:uncharacterized repeat protein (TIGR03803 family)
MNPRLLLVPLLLLLLLAGFTSVAFAQTSCIVTNPNVIYPVPPLTYPMNSDQYAVEYNVGGAGWTNAQVYISYYGGTDASPLNSASGYTPETSLSFVSIPARASTSVQLRVNKLGSGFTPRDHVSVRPSAKPVNVSTASDGTVQLCTVTTNDFAGDQFMLWWGDGAAGGSMAKSGIAALAFFLDPPYTTPTGANVVIVTNQTNLQNVSNYNTLVFQGTVALGGNGELAYLVPSNITNVFLAPGAWVQGKLRFVWGGGVPRQVCGPGVLDGSRFRYDHRACDDDQGDHAISWQDPPATNPVPDTFLLDGIVITDHNNATDDLLVNGVVNNVKTIGWNDSNGGFRLGDNTKVSNVFLRSGDDSLMMWGAGITVTNATVWQNYNGGVVNLGWSDNSPGDGCVIDGLYVVKTDWLGPTAPGFNKPALDDQNNAVIASLMVPGTRFGTLHPPLFRNILVEDSPRVLFSLKILFPECGDPGSPIDLQGGCMQVQLTNSSVLNLDIENLLTPAPLVENLVGFQIVGTNFAYEFPPGTTNSFTNGYTFTGSMNLGLTNVIVQMPDGAMRPLTSALAAGSNGVMTSGNNVRVNYDFVPSRFSSWFRTLPGLATGLGFIPAGHVTVQSLAILGLHDFTGGNDGAAPVAGLVLSGNTLYGTANAGGTNGSGTVFAINTNGTGFTNLYSFSATDTNGCNSDGADPEAVLLLSGNTLYGLANGGGSSGNGTVFSVNTNGTGFTNLYSFSATDGNGNNRDGANPQGPLTLSGNTLYGTAAYGGSSGAGTVFAVTTNGTGFTNLYSFTGGNDGSFPLAGLILSGNTLYGTANAGGTNGSGTVFAINTNGVGFTKLYSFSATDTNGFNNDGADPEAGLTLSGSTLYGTAEYGGSSGTGTVFAINTNGASFTNLYSFSATDTNGCNNDGANPEARLLLSGATLYGTVNLGGNSDNGTVFSVNTNGSGFAALSSFSATDGNGDNSDGASPQTHLVLSGNTLYGVATYGGSSGNGTVFAASTIFDQIMASPTAGLAPLMVDFSASGVDSSGNAITNWNWSFGDGSATNSQNPSHTYTTAGAFSPSLLATNNNGVLISETAPSITVSGPAVAFTASPTNGPVPLTVSFTAAGVDSSGHVITHWNWTFGDGSATNSQNPSHTYTTAGAFAPALIATNNLGGTVAGSGPASISTTVAPVSSGLVLNGGFETGDFTGWTLSGSDTNDIFVDDGSQSGINPHSGNYLAALGPVGSVSYLSQTLATTPGAVYALSFWLNSPDGFTNNEFLVSWDGQALFDQVNLSEITGWTNLQFTVVAAGSSSVLQFGARDDNSYFGLDDISVAPAPLGIASVSLSGTNLVLNGINGQSGATYYVLRSTNLFLPLSQWTPIATNALANSGNFTITVTNTVTTRTPQRFYILKLQ